MSQTFQTDPRLLANSLPVIALDLCDVRLMEDARFPWLVLIPRRVGVSELDDLSGDDQMQLMAEIVRAGAAVRQLGLALDQPVDKLNTAALGNVTSQLHIHVVGRRRDDPLWPDPIWGRPGATPRTPEVMDRLVEVARATLG